MIAAAVATPVLLVGNALWLLAWPWLASVVYRLPGFPGDADLTRSARRDLAATGIDAIQPWDADGIAGMIAARLPGGLSAFNRREIDHMQDVRGVVTALLVAWVVAIAVMAIACVLARAGGAWPGPVLRGLRSGALATLAVVGALGLFALLAPDAFFTAFHGVFFEGDSWRFPDRDTLRRLYPDAFWAIAGGLLGGLVLVQALVLARLSAVRPRRRGAWARRE